MITKQENSEIGKKVLTDGLDPRLDKTRHTLDLLPACQQMRR